MKTNLFSLPFDVLTVLVEHIHNIEDFTSFTSTCHALRNLAIATSPQQILRLAAASAPTFFRPHPHFLIASTVCSVTSPVRTNPELLSDLIAAFRNGIDGLYAHCLIHGSLTLTDIRRWHTLRFSTLNPLATAIDNMAGPTWAATPNFYSGGVSEPSTLDTDPELAAYQLVIYAEAFGRGGFDAFLDCKWKSEVSVVDLSVRLEYIKYCIPDAFCDEGYAGFKVLETGPYVDLAGRRERRDILSIDQVCLKHVLNCARWRRLREGIMKETGGNFVDYGADALKEVDIQEYDQQREQPVTTPMQFAIWNSDDDEYEIVVGDAATPLDRQVPLRLVQEPPNAWRQKLWVNALMLSDGVDSLKLIMEYSRAKKLADTDRERLVGIRTKISELHEGDKPSTRRIGKYSQRPCSQSPDPLRELGVCTAKRWGGDGERWWPLDIY